MKRSKIVQSKTRKKDDPTKRAWQRMLSGRSLDLLDPSPLDIEIEDIALGLSRVARWNGQTKGEYGFSVAQHCVLVTDLCLHIKPDLKPKQALIALLHDAPEYVIGDMISPFKAALGIDYKRFESHLEQSIHIRFGLEPLTPKPLKALIKQADHASAYYEATQLVGFSDEQALHYFGEPPIGFSITIECLSAKDAMAQFLDRFNSLAQD